ncbi:MAG: hypothetical protein M3Y25_01650, partial [Thermoproteota archaeon]|nr:hypothetical protein [Thermoproteota archaeon]
GLEGLSFKYKPLQSGIVTRLVSNLKVTKTEPLFDIHSVIHFQPVWIDNLISLLNINKINKSF